MALYEWQEEIQYAELVASDFETNASWQHLPLTPPGEAKSPEKDTTLANSLTAMIAADAPTLFHLPADHKFPEGAWPEPTTQALLLPLRDTSGQVMGCLLAGLSPRRALDAGYTIFLENLADIISTELNRVHALAEERRRHEALAEIDRAKTIFFSNISHEFRTPLTLILGPLEELLQHPALLEAITEGDGLAQVRAHIESSHRNSLRLLRLVNTLLDFSRIESGRMDAVFRPLDLAAYTTDLASGFRSTIEKAGLQFQVETAPLDQPVFIDVMMWEKIVLNLLSNAFKYTLDGTIKIGLQAQGDSVVLEISDTGIGIPAESLPRMFERFHRVQNAQGRSHEGTGIGLSLVQELVQMHGGAITVQSIEGQGSTFTVRIPLGKEHLPQHQVSESATAIEMPDGSKFISSTAMFSADEESVLAQKKSPETTTTRPLAHILIVDDNADMRVYLQHLLSPHFLVETAIHGADALEKIAVKRPDLVLSDVMMPVMDGNQLLQTLKSSAVTATLPIILLSARAGEEAKVEGYEAGADDYLVKPFAAKELLARVQSHLRLSAARRHVENQLRNLFEQAPVAIALFRGPNHVVELVNEKMLEYWKKTADQLLGKPYFEGMPEVAGQGFEEIMAKVYETGEAFISNEGPAQIMNDGVLTTGYFNYVCQAIRDANGIITGLMAISSDVTEAVLARRKVQQESERMQRLFKQAPFSMIIYRGADMRFELVNDSALKTMGKTWEELANRPVAEIFPERAAKNGFALHHQVFETGQTQLIKEAPLTFIQEGKTYNGWFDAVYEPLLDEQGQITGVLAVGHDVTEKVLARQKTEEAEARLRDILMQAPFPVVIYRGPELRVDLANQMMLETVGRTWEQIAHRPVVETFPELAAANWHAPQLRTFETGEREVIKARKVTLLRDGKPYTGWFDSVYEPWRDASGQVVGVISISYEVTEEITARQKIEAAEARLRNVFMQAPMGINIYRGEDLRIEVSNETALRMMNKTWEEVAGRSVIEIFPEIKERFAIHREVFATGQRNFIREAPFTLYYDGQPSARWYDSEYVPYYDFEGKEIIGVIVIGYDVTEKVLARKAVEESEMRYVNLLRESPFAVGIFKGYDMVITMANVAIKAIWGKGDEVENKPFLVAMPEIVDQPHIVIMRRVFETGEPFIAHEMPGQVLRNGRLEQAYFNFVLQPLREADGSISGVVCIAQEVTTQAVANQLVAASEANVRNLFAQAPAAICVVRGTDYVLELANDRMLEIWGRSADILAKPIFQSLPEAKGQGFEALLEGVFTTGERFVANEMPINLMRGGTLELVYLNFVYEPLREADGSVSGIMAVAIDVTQSVLVRQKIVENEQRMNHLFEQAPVAIAIFKGQDFRAELANDKMQELLGRSFEEMRDQPAYHLFPERENGTDPDLIRKMIFDRGERVSVVEMKSTFRRNDEMQTGYFSFVLDPLRDNKGEVTGALLVATDVTFQVLSRRQIIESEVRMRELLAQAPVGIAIYTGRDLIVELANDRALEIWGLTFEEVGGRSMKEIFPDSSLSKNAEQICEAIFDRGERMIEIEMEYSFMRKGERVTVYFNSTREPLRNELGEVTGMMVVANEVTQQVLARRKVEESERDLRKIQEDLELALSTGGIGIWQWDAKTDNLRWSKEQALIYGEEPGVYENGMAKWQAYVHPDDVERLDQEFLEAIQKGNDYSYEFRAVLRDGSIRWIQAKSKIQFDEAGSITQVNGVNLDVTAEKLAAENLIKSEQQYRQLSAQLEQNVAERTAELSELNDAFEHAEGISKMGNFKWDFAKNVITWSKNMYALHGVTPDVFTPTLDNIMQFVHPDDVQKVHANGLRAFETQTSLPLGYRIVTVAGELKHVYGTSNIITQDNGQKVMVGTLQDVTEMKLAEQQLLQQNMALEQSNRSLEQFAHIASHDLQEPLRKIQTFTNLLQRKWDDRQELEKYVGKIEESARRMSQLIQAVLNYSRVSHTQNLVESTDLNEVLARVRIDFELLIEEKQAIFEYGTLPTISGLPLQLSQLFSNLLSNALKFSAQRPHIRLISRPMSADEIAARPQLDPALAYYYFRFEDNGIGFSQEYSERIFAIFQRLHDRQSYAGTGIGLALCKKIVDNHKGDIWAESTPHEGTVFHICLPAAL